MKSGPSQEPTMRADRTIDSALITVTLALFVATAFGLSETAGGVSVWQPSEWKGVHDAAKALILPLLALRFGLAMKDGPSADRTLRNRVLTAMALCWIGDLALTFSGETAFLIGLVSFLLGHVFFIMALRQVFLSGWGQSKAWIRVLSTGLMSVEAIAVAKSLWEPAGTLAPAVAGYAVVITIMALLTWYLALGPGVLALRVGATAFLASDMILAFGKFGEAPIPHGHLWVMATYILAQWALAVGFTQVASRPKANHP